MADVELVVKIPEHVYHHAVEHSEDSNDEWFVMRAIANGTPLPKGHGDLIDRKELTKHPPIWMEDKRRTGEDDAVMLLSDILKAEPIIKANKGEQEWK